MHSDRRPSTDKEQQRPRRSLFNSLWPPAAPLHKLTHAASFDSGQPRTRSRRFSLQLSAAVPPQVNEKTAFSAETSQPHLRIETLAETPAETTAPRSDRLSMDDRNADEAPSAFATKRRSLLRRASLSSIYSTVVADPEPSAAFEHDSLLRPPSLMHARSPSIAHAQAASIRSFKSDSESIRSLGSLRRPALQVDTASACIQDAQSRDRTTATAYNSANAAQEPHDHHTQPSARSSGSLSSPTSPETNLESSKLKLEDVISQVAKFQMDPKFAPTLPRKSFLRTLRSQHEPLPDPSERHRTPSFDSGMAAAAPLIHPQTPPSPRLRSQSLPENEHPHHPGSIPPVPATHAQTQDGYPHDNQHMNYSSHANRNQQYQDQYEYVPNDPKSAPLFMQMPPFMFQYPLPHPNPHPGNMHANASAPSISVYAPDMTPVMVHMPPPMFAPHMPRIYAPSPVPTTSDRSSRTGSISHGLAVPPSSMNEIAYKRRSSAPNIIDPSRASWLPHIASMQRVVYIQPDGSYVYANTPVIMTGEPPFAFADAYADAQDSPPLSPVQESWPASKSTKKQKRRIFSFFRKN